MMVEVNRGMKRTFLGVKNLRERVVNIHMKQDGYSREIEI